MYPIFDSYAVESLWSYRNQDHFTRFLRQDLWYYDRFVATVTAFRDFYKLDCLTFRQVDKFLWRSGDRILRAMEQKKAASEIEVDSSASPEPELAEDPDMLNDPIANIMSNRYALKTALELGLGTEEKIRALIGPTELPEGEE